MGETNGPESHAANIEAGTQLLNFLDVVAVEHNGGYDSIWTMLDRAGCNQLIRTTRRARDAAYGRDE